MSPRVLHRKLGRHLFFIVGATLVFFLVALNGQRIRSKLPERVTAHVNEELDVEIVEDARTSQFQVPHGSSREKPTVGGARKTLVPHVWRLDGLLEVNSKGRHPIYDLVDNAKKKWNAKMARQSKTLREAVREYKRRYQRDPPLGFDDW